MCPMPMSAPCMFETAATALILLITVLEQSDWTAKNRRRAIIISRPSANTRAGAVPAARASLAQWPTTSVHKASCTSTSGARQADNKNTDSRVSGTKKMILQLGQASVHILRIAGQTGKWAHRSPLPVLHPKGQGSRGPPNRPVVVQALQIDRTIDDCTTCGTTERMATRRSRMRPTAARETGDPVIAVARLLRIPSTRSRLKRLRSFLVAHA